MYELNKIKFISERFDNETVLIDVENGFYYSLSESGTDILDLIEKRVKHRRNSSSSGGGLH